MEYIIYIGAALVIGLLIGFITLSVIWLRKTMLRNIRSHTLDLISVYDDLLEEKSRELAALQQEISHREEALAEKVQEDQPIPEQDSSKPEVSPSTLLAIAEQAAGATYRDDTAAATYHQIRDSFSFEMEEIAPMLARQPQMQDSAAANLLKELPYETVYQLSTLTEDEQLAVLASSLSDEGCVLLEEYLSEHAQFQVFAFYDSLKSSAAARPQETKLYVPDGVNLQKQSYRSFDVAVDSNICEGFQLETDGKLYDYSIKTKELRE